MNLLTRSLLVTLGLLATFLAVETNAFVVQRSGLTTKSTKQLQPLYMAEEEDKLRALGYSEDEIRRTKKISDDDTSVNVNLLPDVDAATLTAVGFGLIALNFFVFANMGDGGIAGPIATIMNNW
jgi:hypothetical protein